MPWEVEVTDQFEQWWDLLTAEQQDVVEARVLQLAQLGPNLGRPAVDRLSRSRHHNMKELRADRKGSCIRILFAFDPRRAAILLIGGDKADPSGPQWNAWYETFIAVADDLYDEHLRGIDLDP
jgi:hypothetical protein